MPGRIKAGEGSLIGNSGEHYVLAELLKRGIIAAMTPRNTPAFDILATNGKESVRIRVKTKSEEYKDYQWNLKKDGVIFRLLSRKNDFVVLVNIKKSDSRPDFHIVPTVKVDSWIKASFRKWLETPGRHGRHHDPENKKRNLPSGTYERQLKQYKDKWDSIWQASQR